MKNNYITRNPDETKLLAHKLAVQLHGGEVLCLYGELGSGKTVFVSGLIHYFLPKVRVLSPTFIIVRHYQTSNSSIKEIHHADFYRISKPQECKNLGILEFMHKSSVVLAIEWAERLGEFLPDRRIDIHIINQGDNQRLFKIKEWKI